MKHNAATQTEPYFVTSWGQKVYYWHIASQVKEYFPEVLGKHIFVQLDRLGIRSLFDGASTPFPLPYTFA